jgi:hypothetical protein
MQMMGNMEVSPSQMGCCLIKQSPREHEQANLSQCIQMDGLRQGISQAISTIS